MTTTAAPFPASSTSILAPLLLGIHTAGIDSRVNVFELAWQAAADAVPVSAAVLTVAVARNQTQQIRHTRQITTVNGSNTYAYTARLTDRRSGEKATAAWSRWRWEVSALVVKRGYQSIVGNADQVVRVDVTRSRLLAGAVQQAHELALFRHLIVTGLQAMDPDLVVLGGQHSWDDSWWTVPGSSTA